MEKIIPQSRTSKFIKRMLEEKGIDCEIIQVESEELHFTHMIEMEKLLTYIDSTSPETQIQIKSTLIKIDFKAGDVMHYIKHLASAYAKVYELGHE